MMTQLPLLGGNNGTVGTINNLGQVAGIAETGTPDASCASATPFQALRYEAVIWGPNPGEIHPLPPFGNDTVGMAFWINDNGQAVGASGLCANTPLPSPAFGPHAVLWEKDGSVHDLGNLGGTVVNIAFSINNQGHVVGASSLTAQSTPFSSTDAFLWTREKGMRDLHTLPGDDASAGFGINDGGEVVGLSIGSGGPRAVLWQNEVIADLNTLIPAHSPFLVLLFATAINSSGEIVGFGVHRGTGDVHAYLATPSNGAASESFAPTPQDVTSPMVLSEDARKLLQQRLPFGRFGGQPMGPR